MNSRQYASAREALSRVQQINPESQVRELAMIELLEGHAEKALELAPHNPHITALAAHTLGRKAQSQHDLEELVSQFAQVEAYQIAEVYAWRGETDKAFQWLDRAYAQIDAGLMCIKSDPFLDNIRSDPRFAAMLKKMNLPE